MVHLTEFVKYEGVIFDSGYLDEGYFLAVLVNTADASDCPKERETDISVDEVALEHRHFLEEPGTVFNWSIGYIDTGSRKIRVSEISFPSAGRFREKNDLEDASQEMINQT